MKKNLFVILIMSVLCSCASQEAGQRGVASETVAAEEPEVVGALDEILDTSGNPIAAIDIEAAEASCSKMSMFSPAEVARQKGKMPQILATASGCIDEYWKNHKSFHAKNKVSKYFGNRNKKYDTLDERIAAIKALGKSDKEARRIASEQENISCIDLALRCLGRGYKNAGEGAIWSRVQGHANGFGTELQRALQSLGWNAAYWNPDPSRNAEWDAADKERLKKPEGKAVNPAWGQHTAHYNRVKGGACYYNIKIDDSSSLVGFKGSVPGRLKNCPFYVGTAHTGYHVFPGKYGEVIEAHSMRNIGSIENLEKGPFKPANGGAPFSTNTEHYRSGVLLLPPGC